MRCDKCRHAFTLIEVLIVVVIIAVLAATIIPLFSSSSHDAMEGMLKSHLRSLRTQIEVYRQHHLGRLPTISGGSLPQLTWATNVEGEVGMAGPAYPFGPYAVTGLPANPISGSKLFTATAKFPPTAASGNGGWLYHEATGQVAADTEGYLDW
ncbi:MAG: prepilin-type N-terminal cleavage/methylation domain-containing protein [Pirellulales bacterium]